MAGESFRFHLDAAHCDPSAVKTHRCTWWTRTGQNLDYLISFLYYSNTNAKYGTVDDCVLRNDHWNGGLRWQ